MRRTYILPSIMVVHTQTGQMIADSGVTSDIGIDYGGKVGEGDNINPEAKASHNIWDEEW